MAAAWVYQDPKQVKKHGTEKASWYVGYREPGGKQRCKSCGPGKTGKRLAERLCKQRAAELLTGTYSDSDKAKRTWEDFVVEYETEVFPRFGEKNRAIMARSMKKFASLVNPKRVQGITTKDVDSFVAKRIAEEASPATINKELRCLRAVLRKAAKWGYFPKGMPSFDFLKEPEKLPPYVTPDHFTQLYQACDAARWPDDQPYPAADWWRALLLFIYMTGWRIGSVLALRKADVDLEKAAVLSLAKDNKGKRDQRLCLHPLVVDHLRKLATFSERMFPWNHDERGLYNEFARIQEVAKVKPAWGRDRYGFHDLRRAFATMNADRLSADAMQAMMQHRDYQTTRRYINLARQLQPAAENLFVPELQKKSVSV